MRAQYSANSAWRRWSPSSCFISGERLGWRGLSAPRRQRRSAASMQTVSLGASTLKLEQTSRSRTCPSWKSSSSRRRSLSKPGISSAAANRSAGSLERTSVRCSSMSSRIVKLSPPEVYGGETQNGHLQPLEQQ